MTGHDLKEAVQRFKSTNPILQIIGSSTLKRAGRTNGGEWCGPCPLCGGTDRLRVWPNHPRNGPSAWCRRCNTSGDSLAWAMRKMGIEPKARAGATAAFLRTQGFLADTSKTKGPKLNIRQASKHPATTTSSSQTGSHQGLRRFAPLRLPTPRPKPWPILLEADLAACATQAFAEALKSVSDDEREALTERAAILEADGLSRSEAESMTLQLNPHRQGR